MRLIWRQCGRERYGKGGLNRQVWIRETNANEPLMTHRKAPNDIKTGDVTSSQDEHGGCLFTDHAVSGV
jgi:hypothetical protein